MKKSFTLFTLFTLLIISVPIYARESHAGRPGDLGGVSIASRESHAGKPSSPSIGTSGSLGSMGSASLYGISSRSDAGFWSISSLVPVGVSGTLFSLFLYAIYQSPSRLLF